MRFERGIKGPRGQGAKGSANRRPMIAALFLVLCISGCRSAQVAEPLTRSLAGNDADSQMAFWHTLADRRVTSNDEALHAMLLFLDGQDEADDYDGRVALLQSRQLLAGDFQRPADEAVRRGDVASMVARILKIKGGLTMRLVGPTPRYALRELQYRRVFPPGSVRQTLSGSELLSVIGKMEDYQRMVAFREQRGDSQAADSVDAADSKVDTAGGGALDTVAPNE